MAPEKHGKVDCIRKWWLLDQSRRSQPQPVVYRSCDRVRCFFKADPGFEIFHGTSPEVGVRHETGINFGLICNLTDTQHIILSAGPAIQGQNQLQGYFAYQLTLI